MAEGVAGVVQIKLLFFAKARELSGVKETTSSIPSTITSTQLWQHITGLYPSLEPVSGSVVLAINEEYTDIDDLELTLNTGDEVAVIPPISGGTTRDNFDGKKVVRLEYEAFIPMAEKEIRKICDRIRKKWNVEHIAVYHRLGLVPVTEASVVIAVSSPHRKESLEAVHFAIDELKATVPIWKKEIYEEGAATWKENKECSWRKDTS